VIQVKCGRVVKNWEFARLVEPFTTNFKDNGFGRKYSRQYSHDKFHAAFEAFGLEPDSVEPDYGIFCGYNYLDGAAVQPHIDYAPKGYVHVRSNLMLKKPESGGNPVIDGYELCVEEGDLWLCFASLERHCSTPVKGGERIIMSFGALINENKVHSIFI
jgi:hypothetical protein